MQGGEICVVFPFTKMPDPVHLPTTTRPGGELLSIGKTASQPPSEGEHCETTDVLSLHVFAALPTALR